VRGKDDFYIKMSDLQLVTRIKKSELKAIAENLKDISGNPARSPSGRPIYRRYACLRLWACGKFPGNVAPKFTLLERLTRGHIIRSPWACSWYGLMAICTAAKPDLGSEIMSYDREMEDFQKMLQALTAHSDMQVDLEINGHTASSIAASGGNWKVLDELLGHGALLNQPALIEALALNNELGRLKDSLEMELKSGFGRLASIERLHDIFTKTCAAGHPDCAFAIHTYMHAAGMKTDVDEANLMEAVAAQQHWMIDVHVKTSTRLGEDVLGKAILVCSENGDHRSLEKLLNAKANPNYGYSSTKGWFTSPLLIAGKRWASSGSEDHCEIIVRLLQYGADLRQHDEEGHTIIIWAAMRGHNKLLRLALATAAMFLSSSGVDKVLNQQDLLGYSPLMHAVMSLQDDCVIKLLQLGVDADLLCSAVEGQAQAMTALALLTSNCSRQVPSFLIPLLEKTTKLTVCDQWGDTFITWACRWGHADAVKKALELNGADALHVHAYEEGKQSALELAIIGRHREIARMIINTWRREFACADAKREGKYVGVNVLHEAVQNDWQDVAQLFIEVANPFDSQSHVVLEAMFACVEKRWIGCLKALLDRDVDPSQQRQDGSIPIITAVKMKDDETLALLLRKGAKNLEISVAQAIFLGYHSGFELLWDRVEHTADLVRAAACIASINNQLDILKVVLKAEKPEMILHRYGSKVRTICYNWCPKKIFCKLLTRLDWTLFLNDPSVPLLCAVSKGHYSCTSYLLQHDADPLIQDDNGLTPLLWACAQGNLDIVKLLLKRGASITLPPGQAELSFADIKKAYHRARMNEAIRFLNRRNPLFKQAEEPHSINISLSPLLVALLKGQTDVARLLLEAGASRQLLTDWCKSALEAEPQAGTILKRIMDIAMEYEDLKAYGPFGFSDHPLNFSDAKFVPQEGRLSSIIVQFADCHWSLEGIQFVHQVNGADVYCRRHHTSQPKAGEWETCNANMHVERMDLATSEYIIQVCL
jgi:ankyrin repeat protein